MTDTEAVAAPTDALGLLEGAIGYALGAVRAVTPQRLPGPTPCADWDLRTLLHHLNDALDVLGEGIDPGRIGPHPAGGGASGQCDLVAHPAAIFRGRAGRLLGAWSPGGRHGRVVAVAGHRLTASAVAATGAIEIAVHGWDVSQACGQARPIPAALATALLAI